MPSRLVLALTLAMASAGCADTQVAERGGAEYLGSFTWSNAHPDFGGLSAVEIVPETGQLMAIGDRGTLVLGRLVRQETGLVAAVEDVTITPLRGPDGLPLTGEFADSEGLDLAPDGTFLVSFENRARILAYPSSGGVPTVLPSPRDFEGLSRNGALEALAVAPDGSILTIPERAARSWQPFNVYRFANGRWDVAGTIPREGEYRPTGADFGPDGRLYLLERRFLGVFGFSSRVRSFSYGPEGLADERTVLVSPTGLHDNLEGISVWRDANDAIRLLMVSDDNQIALQRTELVEYRLTE